MRVILTNDVPSLGSIGHIVNVKNGYARNYLLPRSLAVLANESNQKELDHKKRVFAKKRDAILAEAKKLAAVIEKLTVTISKQVGEDERIFGTVTTAEVSSFLVKEGVTISKKDIHFLEEIKKVGAYTADVRLHSEVTAKLKVWVVALQA